MQPRTTQSNYLGKLPTYAVMHKQKQIKLENGLGFITSGQETDWAYFTDPETSLEYARLHTTILG